MTLKGRCVVLVSDADYAEEHRPVLRRLLDEGIELFCTVGRDCERWEDAMDRLCVELDVSGERPGAFCLTTSHPGESVEEVIEFARSWNLHEDRECEVRVVEV
jgi:hypothetical protein